ncbi:MAG: hypothetical protein WCW66_06560 [Patescibacteria group bacterium]
MSNNPNNIRVGDVIWREVFFSRFSPSQMDDLLPVESEHGGIILRAAPGEFYSVRDDRPWVITSGSRRGLICFCYFPLPADTSNVIGFEVCRINKNATSVCVKPVFGQIATLLEHYNVPSEFLQHARQA